MFAGHTNRSFADTIGSQYAHTNQTRTGASDKKGQMCWTTNTMSIHDLRTEARVLTKAEEFVKVRGYLAALGVREKVVCKARAEASLNCLETSGSRSIHQVGSDLM